MSGSLCDCTPVLTSSVFETCLTTVSGNNLGGFFFFFRRGPPSLARWLRSIAKTHARGTVHADDLRRAVQSQTLPG
jgi:hypothetical protein